MIRYLSIIMAYVFMITGWSCLSLFLDMPLILGAITGFCSGIFIADVVIKAYFTKHL